MHPAMSDQLLSSSAAVFCRLQVGEARDQRLEGLLDVQRGHDVESRGWSAAAASCALKLGPPSASTLRCPTSPRHCSAACRSTLRSPATSTSATSRASATRSGGAAATVRTVVRIQRARRGRHLGTAGAGSLLLGRGHPPSVTRLQGRVATVPTPNVIVNPRASAGPNRSRLYPAPIVGLL